jgi:DNA-binding MarR family transcriptional regulator
MFNTVPALVNDIARQVRYRFDARTRMIGVTRPQWRVLLVIARLDRPSQSEVAELLDVERITLCRMVDRLAETGLVERHADPADRRVWRLQLTEKALPLIDRLSEIGEELESELLSVLSPEERNTLTDLLTRLRIGMASRDEIMATADRGRAVA